MRRVKDPMGMGETSISGTFGGKIPKNPVFWGGDRGKNLGDFPHTNVYTTLVPIKIALNGLNFLSVIQSLKKGYKGPSINYVSTAEGGRGQPNAHRCSRGGRGCI